MPLEVFRGSRRSVRHRQWRAVTAVTQPQKAGYAEEDAASSAIHHAPAVPRPVLDGLRKMVRPKGTAAFQIRDRPGQAQHTVIRPGGQVEPSDRGVKELSSCGIDVAFGTQQIGSHLGVGMDVGTAKSLELPLARRPYPLTDAFARLCYAFIRQLPLRKGRHVDMQVDAVEQRS